MNFEEEMPSMSFLTFEEYIQDNDEIYAKNIQDNYSFNNFLNIINKFEETEETITKFAKLLPIQIVSAT